MSVSSGCITCLITSLKMTSTGPNSAEFSEHFDYRPPVVAFMTLEPPLESHQSYGAIPDHFKRQGFDW